MKRVLIVLPVIIMMFMVSSCSTDITGWQVSASKNPLTVELKGAQKIVFTNKKEETLKFTVSDSKVISQIAEIIGRAKKVGSTPGVEQDYDIKFYFPSGKQRAFNYWICSSDNNHDVNFKDDKGNYYMVSEDLDDYIVNSTKMSERPKCFVKLYTMTISKCIGLLEKNKDGETTVGVDIKSDRRMRKYTASYEEEKLLSGITVQGYKVLPYEKDGKYTYTLTYVTNIYNPDKAQITVEVISTADRKKTTYIFDAQLESGSNWLVNCISPKE